ncbi:hypothetical protein PHACT_00130 [Pseudohongiella acticola]|uniref:Spore protein YkvP/CgeB glycosyl transferase-like domain-containing protein n=1 Tax=Pseudohongiella acticola TaxID=1524254 RepID=A0A1E8CH98_9GAMM|nr:glycosyltransferase [Pseudohongiella acticola]OFE11758.1 hypothetical protein PHACT_00130 [Pseudohongiella acticola]
MAVVRALDELGHDVEAFYWCNYFNSREPLLHFWKRIQNKFLLGPAIFKINADLVQVVARFRPDLVFIYRGTHILASTINAIKQSAPGCVVFGYNNDDPFAEGHSPFLWRHFLKSTPSYDLMFAYRHHNIGEYLSIGAKRAELLRSWYLPWSNCPVVLDDSDRARYECDVVFAGHFEDDGRLQLLEKIVSSGFSLRLYGPPGEWDRLIEKSPILNHIAPIRQIWGDEYNKAISGAKIALCFLSKLNRDTYTRRCFELPAMGTLLLSEYSNDLASLYSEGEEAEFFRSSDELLFKISKYIKNEKDRCRIAGNGKKRVVDDGHDIFSRMSYVLSFSNGIPD